MLGPGRVPELAAADPEILGHGRYGCARGAGPGPSAQPPGGAAGPLAGWPTARPPAKAAWPREPARMSAASPAGWTAPGPGRRAAHVGVAGNSARLREPARPSRPTVPAVASHGDFQPRNWLWDTASGRLGIIDWERAEPAEAIGDLVRLEYGPWDGRPDLREQFFEGYGRALTPEEDETLFCYVGLDALSGLRWAWPTATTRLSAAPGRPSNDRLTRRRLIPAAKPPRRAPGTDARGAESATGGGAAGLPLSRLAVRSELGSLGA